MTIEEAINVMHGYKRLDEYMKNTNRLPACYMAISALEKQIPKKPTYDGYGYMPDGTFLWDKWLCPNCKSSYDVVYDDYNYCPVCGQRIDFGKDEENE